MPSVTKKDYFLVAVIGFLFGLLLLPVLKNINLPFFELNFSNAALLIVGFTVFAVFALGTASLIGGKIPVIFQFAKFGAVGALNTLLDLGVLNLLIFLSGIAAGFWYSGFKAASFVAASINSYFWNRYWTFGAGGSASIKEFSQFFVVTLIGFGINVGTASFIVNVIGPLAGISANLWANIGALLATALSLIWNFLGYKFIVFRA
jgi:putative flippase GtrA